MKFNKSSTFRPLFTASNEIKTTVGFELCKRWKFPFKSKFSQVKQYLKQWKFSFFSLPNIIFLFLFLNPFYMSLSIQICRSEANLMLMQSFRYVNFTWNRLAPQNYVNKIYMWKRGEIGKGEMLQEKTGSGKPAWSLTWLTYIGNILKMKRRVC